MNAAMLTLRDLAGYRTDTQLTVEEIAGSTNSHCEPEAIGMVRYREGATAIAGAEWFSPTTGLLIIQALTLLPARRSNSLDPIREALAGCATWQRENRTYTLTATDYGPYGDESLGFLLTIQEGGEPPTAYATVYVRTGNLFMALQVLGAGRTTPLGAEAIFDRAARKLPRP
ncbi:MAG TPA: hypothetical protein VFM55_15525 [Micromonosporaceae bacterium]|nr:hypothetical protein [Micromonosporaceae bacterium]